MEQLLRLSDSGEQDTGDRHTPMIENVLRDSLRITLIKALIDGSRCDEKQRDQALEELFLHPQNMSGEMADWLITQTHKVCRCFSKGQHSRMDDVIGDVLEYLEGLYANPNISLSSTAEHFRISEAYLSHQFKEQTGENFGSCLERIRQNHAHTLLTQTNLSIEDIATKVGYSSADTFRKAFKRYHGINPAKYRELNQK